MSDEKNTKANPWRKATIVILAVVASVLAIWDIIVVFLNNENHDSISKVVQGFGQSNWAIPFFFGMVFIGHFFWPGRSLYSQPWAFITIAVPWVCVFVAGMVFDLPKIPTLLPALLGILAGRFFWPLGP